MAVFKVSLGSGYILNCKNAHLGLTLVFVAASLSSWVASLFWPPGYGHEAHALSGKATVIRREGKVVEQAWFLPANWQDFLLSKLVLSLFSRTYVGDC